MSSEPKSPVIPLPAAHDAEKTAVVDEAQIIEDIQRVEGTYCQSQLGDKPPRKHFFSPLDPSYSEAVHGDAETVRFSPEEERRVRRKIDIRVLSIVVVSFVFNQFDRTNIGNAHVITAFNDNYEITTNNKWMLALGIFYVGYCLLEMPANILQRHIGANRFFFLSLTFWGIVSLSFVYAKGYAALLTLRVLLSIGEAGFYAGIIYYLSFWYKRYDVVGRKSTRKGDLLAFGLVRGHTSLLTGWQFLFLVEAIPYLIMAVAILIWLPSFPFSATFLNHRERAIAQARVNRDHKPRSHGGMTGWQGVKAVLIDPSAWLLMLIYASFNVGVATISYFMPTLINELGFNDIDAQGMTVAPYLVGWFFVILQAWHSDRTNDRGWHIIASANVALIGYIILATGSQKSVGAAYFAIFLAIGGLYSLFPLVMSWAANVFSPTSKRGVGTAFIVSVSNCVSIASPQVYFDVEDNYRTAHAIVAGCLVVTILAALILRCRLTRKNRVHQKKRDGLEQEGKLAPAGEFEEIADTDPRYVFMT